MNLNLIQKRKVYRVPQVNKELVSRGHTTNNEITRRIVWCLDMIPAMKNTVS